MAQFLQRYTHARTRDCSSSSETLDSYMMGFVAHVTVLSLLLALVGAISDDPDVYYIGVGRADVTGPAAEVEMVIL